MNKSTQHSFCCFLLPRPFLSAVLQELQGPDASAGREPAGLRRHLQGKAAQEEGAQAEDHPAGRRGHRAGPAEQGADRAVAQGTDPRSGMRWAWWLK